MAEFAQRGIEEMLVEAEKMRKIGLFNTDETRAIIKKRKRYEYKLQRRTKEKENFLQYIQYEITLLRLIKLRREKNGIELGKDEIDKEIYLRIVKLFRIACFRFKSDTKLWLTYIDFLKKHNDKFRASKIYTTMLKIHNKKPNLWIMAAKFEFEENDSIETSRSLFQRALRFLPQSSKIWTEYFRMELLCVELIRKRKELLRINEIEDKQEANDELNNVQDAILGCKVVEVVYKNALKQIKNNLPQLINSFIMIASEFNFTADLIDRMYSVLEKDEELNKMEESMDILARRFLLPEREILKKCEETGQVADFTIAEYEEKANEFYRNSLQKSQHSLKLYELYVDFLIERLKLDSKFLNDERFERLVAAFKQFEEKFQYVPIEHVIEWVEFALKFNKNEQAAETIDKYIKVYKNSKDLWQLKLKHKTQTLGKSSQKEILDLFRNSLDSIKDKECLDLWKLAVDWCVKVDSDHTEALFAEGSQVMDRQISSFVRAEYLKWCMKSPSGIDKVRSIYENLRKMPPFCVEFFLNYIDLEKESSSDKPNIARISNAYEEALMHFGKNDLDLWLSYIKFKCLNMSSSAGASSVSDLYWKAMKQLNQDLVDDFVQKFCLLKIELKNNKLGEEANQMLTE